MGSGAVGVVLARWLAGMRFKSQFASVDEDATAPTVLALALASLLVRGGERVALLGGGQRRHPVASASAPDCARADRFARR